MAASIIPGSFNVEFRSWMVAPIDSSWSLGFWGDFTFCCIPDFWIIKSGLFWRAACPHFSTLDCILSVRAPPPFPPLPLLLILLIESVDGGAHLPWSFNFGLLRWALGRSSFSDHSDWTLFVPPPVLISREVSGNGGAHFL